MSLEAEILMIDVNTAPQEELMELLDISEDIVGAILDARPFNSIDELLSISGIGPRTLERLKEQELVVGSTHVQKEQMTTLDENKAIVHRYIEEVWNRGNLEVADQLVDADFNKDLSGYSGPEGEKRFVRILRTIFSDWRFTIQDMIAEDNKVVIQWTASGTHIGKFMGVAPTGKSFTITGVYICRVSEGKLVGTRHTDWDRLGILQQVGAFPIYEKLL